MGTVPMWSSPDSGDSPRVGIFRRHPERISQWAENRSVPAENSRSERGVRRTVIARKVCVRWTRASASLTCSSRCRHTRHCSVGDGRGPVTFRKSGEKSHMPFRHWEDSESRLRLQTRRLEKLRCSDALLLRCSDAQMLRCSDAEVGQDRASGVDWPSTIASLLPLLPRGRV